MQSLTQIQTFFHGGNIYEFAKAKNIPQNRVIDFSSNINFVRFKNLVKVSSPYPEPKYIKFKQELQRRYKVDTKDMELFNGGSSAIFSLFRELSFERVYLFAPIYLEYKRASILFNKEIIFIDRFRDDLENIKFLDNSLVIFVNPSTPDGRYYSKKLILSMLEQNVKVLVDESFLDFTEKKSMSRYISIYNNLYILKSLTKFYSSAGARVGVLISKDINFEFEPLWRVSSLDIEYFSSILNSKKFIKKTLETNKKNRELLSDILKVSKRFDKVFDSTANYILTKAKDSQQLILDLARENIMVRECSNFDFLNKNYIRFAVKDKKSILKLKKVLFYQ